jgi:flagellar basal-body rod protein FlgB
MSHAMAVHAGQRHAVTASNMANADTPGYQAQEVQAFAKTFQGQSASGGMKASRTGHRGNLESSGLAPVHDSNNSVSDPNGNSVSIELEMISAVDAKRQHDRAIAIYKSSLGILRASLGRR